MKKQSKSDNCIKEKEREQKNVKETENDMVRLWSDLGKGSKF